MRRDNPLLLSAADWKAKEAALREAYPDIDDLFDTLDGETDLKERIEWTLRSLDKDERHVEALAAEIGDLEARRKRLKDRAQTKRQLITDAMTTAGLSKLEYARWTVSTSWRKAGVVITDETALPETAWRIKREPDKTAIKALLEAGDCPGAAWGNGYHSITIKRT